MPSAQGIPVAIVNRGRTRGDELATVKVDGGCSELLVLLANELLNPSDAGLVILSPGRRSCGHDRYHADMAAPLRGRVAG